MPTREDSDKAQGLLTAAGGVERHLSEVIPSAARAPEVSHRHPPPEYFPQLSSGRIFIEVKVN